MAFVKGVARTGFAFGLINKTNGEAVTAGTTLGFVTKDGGVQTALTNTPVHEGGGQWTVDITVSEMNGDTIGLLFTNSNAIPVNFTIATVSQAAADAIAGVDPAVGESTLSYCYLDFRHEVGLFYGYGRSFYSDVNGTIAAVNGVVTLTGGTWPAEAADMRLLVSSGTYTVATRDSDSQITLDSAGLNLAAGSDFELHPWSDNELTDIDTTIIRGLRQFYVPPIAAGKNRAHNWSFLRQLASLTTSAPYETGTVAVTLGVVTLTGGTWPTWAAGGEIEIKGITYTVNTRDSATQLTLDDTALTGIAAGTAHSLRRPQQDLPDNYGGFEGPLTYRPGTATFYDPIEVMSEINIREKRMVSDTLNRPRVAFLRAKSSDGGGGQRWEIGWWPVPNDAYVLYGRMRVHPGKLTFAKPCPLGGMVHGETILESCLAIAESKLDDTLGQHHQRFLTCLGASIEQDLLNHSADYLGVNRDCSDRGGYVNRRDLYDGELTQYTNHSLHYD